MYQGNNKTALSSQSQIADALIGLMQDHTYAQISICQVCRQADVSRQTFYSLFESKEQVIIYELARKYCPDPEEACCCLSASLSLESISEGYSRYITENDTFLKLLADNDILDCMTDSLRESFLSSDRFFPELGQMQRIYAAGFLAGGLTGIAQCYVQSSQKSDRAELSRTIHDLFGGMLFHR